MSGGRTARQVMLLRDLGAQVLVCTPSYALVIAQALRDAGVDRRRCALELGLFGGEPWGEGMRAEIERGLGLQAVTFYGLSEMCGPGVATECLQARDGPARPGGPLPGRGDRPRRRAPSRPGSRASSSSRP